MAVIEPRINPRSWWCGWCRRSQPANTGMWPITAGTTESSGCWDCAWSAENGVPPRTEEDA